MHWEEPSILVRLIFVKVFFQVAMDEESQEKTTFITRRGVFKFKVLAFGWSNSLAVFQRLMDLVLAGLTWETCLAFLDDIIVMSKDFDQHLERLGQVFERLRKANLKLKAEKCHLFQQKVKFLESVVSRFRGGRRTRPRQN